LADGQGAWVVDDTFRVDPQSFGQPAAEKPLPIPLPAVVLGLSDTALFKKAFAEYASIIDDAAAVLHEQKPDHVPEWKLPRPPSREENGAETFSYFIPLASVFLPDLKPTAVIGKDVVSFSLSIKQAANLAATMAPEFDGPASELDRPLAAVSNFDF